MAEQKQGQIPRVVRTGKRSTRHTNKAPMPQWLRTVRRIASSVGRILLTTALVLIITGCIVGTVMTIYVMQYVDSDSQINLTNLKMSYTSMIYGKDAEGNDRLVQQMHQNENRVWVDYEEIPDCVKMAFVCAEDKRFFEHEGVDFLRTGSAVINFIKVSILHLGDDSDIYGGSTITQQLIKNINGDVLDRSMANKIKEIMQSMNMERHYSKDQILEAYLNYVAVGPNVNGVQAGAQYYFGKDVGELNANEAAVLAVCVKNPTKLIPTYNNTEDTYYDYYVERRESRRIFILSELLKLEPETLTELGMDPQLLTQEEYDAYQQSAPAIVENNRNPSGGMQASSSGGYSYYVDAVIENVLDDFVETFGWTREQAETELLTGGYQIYTPMEIEVQNKLEEMFVNPETFAHNGISDEIIPDAAMVLLSMKEGEEGYVSALVGGRGEKTIARGFNLATDAVRSFGSTIKPLSVYAPAFQMNLINWSMSFVDEPKMYKNESGNVVAAPAPSTNVSELPPANNNFHYANWPNNYNLVYDGNMSIIDAIKVSKNTIPVEIYNLMESIQPMTSYEFLSENFRFPSLVGGDLTRVGQDSMVLGSAGTTLLDLTAAYQIFGNGGSYTEPILYLKVLDANGKIVLDQMTLRSNKVLDSDTAYIMNRALWEVVNGTAGVGGSPSGGRAKMNNGIEVVGKTGTSMDRKDLVFVGVTPYYTAGIRYGHVDNSDISNSVGNSHVTVWNRVMTAILQDEAPQTFEHLKTDSVSKELYCVSSGNLATALCPNVAVGYYKWSSMPPVCSVHGGEPIYLEENPPKQTGADDAEVAEPAA